MTNKLRITIRSNSLRNAMKLNNFSKIKISYMRSVDAKSPLRQILPRNLQDRNGSEARTRVFPRSKGTPTLKSMVLGKVLGNR